MVGLLNIWKFINSKFFLALLSGLFMVATMMIAERLKEAKEVQAQLRDEISVKTTETIKYKNKLGQEVTKQIEYVTTIQQLECSQDSLEQVVYKTIKASDLKLRQLKKAYVLSMNANNSGKYDSVRYVHDTIIDTVYKVKYFNDGFLNAVIYPDSLTYSYNEQIVLLEAKQRVKRKFFLWKWIGWERIIDRNMMEISSNNPHSKLNGRMIKIN